MLGVAVVSEQMPLFATDRRPAPKEAAGLSKEGLGSGAEKLLAELVKRGLPEDAYRAAARLCLALDRKPEDR
jgi:hypothetical protein